jgi:DNA-binding transcriptional LysR family regulator
MRDALDPRRLRYFRAVAEHGSMTAAARRLNVAQPALSYHVAEIEAALGVVLLERRHDGVRLTHAGQALMRHAAIITDAFASAEAELGAIARGDPPLRRLRIAIFASLAEDLTPRIVRTFAERMPDVLPAVRECPSERALHLVETAEVDAAIHLGPEGGAAGSAPLWSESLWLVDATGPDRPEGVPLAEVLDRPLILPAVGNPLRAVIDAAAGTLGRTPNVRLEINGWPSRRGAVMAGLGATVAGAHAIGSAATQGSAESRLAVRHIIAPVIERPISLALRRGIDPVLATALRASFAEAASDLPLSPQMSIPPC